MDRPRWVPRLSPTAGSIAVVVAIPFLIAACNSIWLANLVGDADIWIYNGYFKALGQFAANRAEWGAAKYYETRLPILVPGAIVHAMFSDAVARVILNLCLLHATAAVSVWYVLRTHLSWAAATAATVLLVSDVFYLRTIGWDYIDNAVLAYQGLSFALLTAPRGAPRSRARLIGAGFAVMSMVTVNIASLMWLPVFVAYRLVVVEESPRGRWLRDLGALLAWTGVGGAICLVVYGAISAGALHGPFLYWLGQVRGTSNIRPSEYAVELGWLVTEGHWVTTHFAVLLGAAGGLVAWRWLPRGDPRTSRFALFCFATVTFSYAMLVLGEATKRTCFLARSGAYTSHFLLLTYFALAVLVSGAQRSSRWWWLVPAVGLAPIAAVFKLSRHEGLGLAAGDGRQPVYVLAAVLGAALLCAFLVRHTAARVAAGLVAVAVSLFVPCPFNRDDGIITVRNAILTVPAPVRLFYSEYDPFRLQFVSIAGGLTDHVLHDHYDYFSARRGPVKPGERVAMLESLQPSDLREDVPCRLPGLRPLGRERFPHAFRDVTVHLFEATTEFGWSDEPCRSQQAPPGELVPWKTFGPNELRHLVGDVGAERISARKGRDPAGWVAFTPDLDMDPGSYVVAFDYEANDWWGSHRWEISGIQDGVWTLIGAAYLPPTQGETRTFAVGLALKAVKSFAARAYFSGNGDLSVSTIRIQAAR